ncbi:MAG: exodeoxyribonuclease V subunit gamma, partial [Limisphaerales bacterium]
SFDLPPFNQNSWELGLNRLLLGYGMLGREEQVFEGALPVDEVEGANAEILGRFVLFLKILFSTCNNLKASRSLEEWAATLQKLLNAFFVSDVVSERELRYIRTLCQTLVHHHSLSGCTTKVPLSVIRAHLKNALETGGLNEGFLTGGVTFCALKPMRSLPFKIVCLLGMDDGAFPRQNSRIGFDLLQQKPKPGDPSIRKDDQYLFLETIMAAREKLHISYVGQSAKDNGLQPASVLVSELVDCLCSSFRLPDRALTPDDLVVKHRLQAFSSAYFSGGRLFTFSRANAQGFAALQENRSSDPPFFKTPLAPPDDAFRTVNVLDLAEFFANPSKYFLRYRMRIELARETAALEEDEPFAIGSFDGYALKQELLEKALCGEDLSQSLPLLQASGILPYGRMGTYSHSSLCREVSEMAKRVSPFRTAELLPVSIHHKLGDFQLQGELQISPARHLQYRCATIKGADIVRAWVKHLAVNLALPAGERVPTTLIGSDDEINFAPVNNADASLTTLLSLYWQGLSAPLKFFPASSCAFAKGTFKPSSRARSTPIAAARSVWRGNDFIGGGEADDAAFEFCFRGAEPLDSEFESIAAQVFQPLFAAVTEPEVAE